MPETATDLLRIEDPDDPSQFVEIERRNSLGVVPGHRFDRVDYPFAAQLPLTHGDWSLHLIQSREEILVEGQTMRHCVATCWNQVARGQCYIASLRHAFRGSDLTRVATVEFDRHGGLVQVNGPNNRLINDEARRPLEHLSRRFAELLRMPAQVPSVADASAWTGRRFA